MIKFKPYLNGKINKWQNRKTIDESMQTRARVRSSSGKILDGLTYIGVYEENSYGKKLI